ncbi:hypothetical protein FRC06_010859, partial [Ceratobasidium sp. 370]
VPSHSTPAQATPTDVAPAEVVPASPAPAPATAGILGTNTPALALERRATRLSLAHTARAAETEASRVLRTRKKPGDKSTGKKGG